MENEIKNVIEALADTFEKEAIADYEENHKEQFQGKDFTSLSTYELFKYNIESPIDVHVRQCFIKKYPDITKKQISKISALYAHYDVIEHNISRLVDMERGCQTDKTHYIIKSYIEFCATYIGVEFANRNNPEHNYWEPDFGSAEDWFSFVDSLIDLCWGDPTKYLSKYLHLKKLKDECLEDMHNDERIVTSFIPKYKEILERIKDNFNDKDFEKISKRYYFSLVLFPLLDYIKKDAVTDDIVIEQIKKVL